MGNFFKLFSVHFLLAFFSVVVLCTFSLQLLHASWMLCESFFAATAVLFFKPSIALALS